jgi:nitrate/nitrite transporter NarK
LGWKPPARIHPFTWWVINRLAFLVGATNLSTFAVYFIQARLGFERETAAGPAARLMLVVGVFILLSALPSGWLSDRFGRRSLVILSGLMAALGTLVALLVPNLNLIYVGGTLIGIATGLFYTANWALGTDIVPKLEAGRYLGISNLAGAGAGRRGGIYRRPHRRLFHRQHASHRRAGLRGAVFHLRAVVSILCCGRDARARTHSRQAHSQPSFRLKHSSRNKPLTFTKIGKATLPAGFFNNRGR